MYTNSRRTSDSNWLLPLVIISLSIHSNFASESRILGGEDIHIEEVPWQISLQYNGSHICGGSIYDNLVILTAAHCLNKFDVKDIQIRAGSRWHNKDGIVSGVEKVLQHENYSESIGSNDIALVRLKVPLNFSNSIQPIPLAKKSPKSFSDALVTGWGYQGPSDQPPEALSSLETRILNRLACSIFFMRLIRKDLLCTYTFLRGACYGDSGSPLVVDDKLVGIVAFGLQSCYGPRAYTNIVTYKDWILKAVEQIKKDDPIGK